MANEMKAQVLPVNGVTDDQMKNFWHLVGDGSITRESFQLFLEHRDPHQVVREVDPSDVFNPDTETDTDKIPDDDDRNPRWLGGPT